MTPLATRQSLVAFLADFRATTSFAPVHEPPVQSDLFIGNKNTPLAGRLLPVRCYGKVTIDDLDGTFKNLWSSCSPLVAGFCTCSSKALLHCARATIRSERARPESRARDAVDLQETGAEVEGPAFALRRGLCPQTGLCAHSRGCGGGHVGNLSGFATPAAMAEIREPVAGSVPEGGRPSKPDTYPYAISTYNVL